MQVDYFITYVNPESPDTKTTLMYLTKENFHSKRKWVVSLFGENSIVDEMGPLEEETGVILKEG